MDNKKLLGALGILAVIIVIILALALPKGITLSNAPLPIEAQPTGPQVVAQNPVDGQRLDLSAPIQIQFDQDMDQAKTGDSFSLIDNGTAVPGQLAWDNAQTLTFTPNSPLDPGTVYTATITEATAKDGTTAQDPIQLEFKTIEGLDCGTGIPRTGYTGSGFEHQHHGHL